MHRVFIHLNTLIYIYLIFVLIKTPLIYSIYIIIIIFVLISMNIACYLLH